MIQSVRNVMVHRWIVAGVSAKIARDYADELAELIRIRLAALRAQGQP